MKKIDYYEICNQKLKHLNYSDRTIKSYLFYINQFLNNIKIAPTRLTSEDFQSYLDNYQFTSISQQNQIINAIRFPNDHLSKKSGCPKCKLSKGELKIEEFLKSKKIEYIPQYKFDDCKYIRDLVFDFYLPKENICIEYDGILHFKCVDFFGGEDNLTKTKIRDKIKTQYCKINKINLIRIKFNQFDNIDEILNKKIK